MSRKLEGRIAIVTGSSSGLGRAIAQQFALEGARVVCADLAESSKAFPSPTHESIQMSSGNQDIATFVKCDVSSEEDIKKLVAKAVEFGGRLDIMCNNAV